MARPPGRSLVGGRWEINDRWQVGARWRYGSGQPTYRYIVHDDVLNVYGGPAGLQPEFNILTGEIIDEDEEILPLLGLIIEYAW